MLAAISNQPRLASTAPPPAASAARPANLQPNLPRPTRLRAILAFLGLGAALVNGLPAHAAPHTTPTLLLSHASARPGETVWAGVRLKMDPGWHTYWRNSGESGAPTTITWKLPQEINAGDILWPVPEVYTAEGLTTYVYHDEVTLLVPLTLASNLQPASVTLNADLRWLECEKLCVPGRGSVTATLTIAADSKPSPDRETIERAHLRLPKPFPAPGATAAWNSPADSEKRTLTLEWPAQNPGARPDFFAYAADTFSIAPATEPLPPENGRLKLRASVEKIGSEWPTSVAGLLIERAAGNESTTPGVYEVSLPIGGAASGTPPGSVAAAAGNSPATNVAAAPAPSPGPPTVNARTLLLNLALAFVGGLILNLMPCVLPVIALKILGFVNQSAGSSAEVRKLGLIYGLGVLTSLLVLAGFIITVKGAGKSASWGMQFQNPVFVVAITTLVTLVALNLFGVFEVTLGAGAMGKAGDLTSREGSAGAFFNGVLAVVLATPSSAPILGLALGFAIPQPAPVIIAIFSAVAVGLAAPYVLLSFFPQFLRFLPKPGVWMERFKNAMGFPMVATAIWLLSLTGAHYGNDGILWVGVFLVFVAAAAWIWGQFVQRSSRRQGLATAVALLFLIAGYVGVLEGQLQWRSPRAVNRGSLKHGADGIDWQPWSPQAVAAARQAGRPIFVDFTADWCITCQANKKTSIEIDSVRKRLREINAAALLGDFTAEDESIANELKKFGRAAVPLVLVYPRDPSQPPLVLPELLTPALVLDALDKATR